jgi:Ca2+-transporting ATPase
MTAVQMTLVGRRYTISGATIVRAVELGRSLYDNLMRYIRFQIAVLFGFIGTFLGASIFNILNGIPFLPLQTLWINFTVDVFQAVGLGWSKPREGLMEERPRPKDQPILARRLTTWLVSSGLVMAIGTLAIVAWADVTYNDAVGHTMGLATFSFFHVFFALETANEDRTIFSRELLENPMLLRGTAFSVIAIVAATEAPSSSGSSTVSSSHSISGLCASWPLRRSS